MYKLYKSEGVLFQFASCLRSLMSAYYTLFHLLLGKFSVADFYLRVLLYHSHILYIGFDKNHQIYCLVYCENFYCILDCFSCLGKL